MLKPEYITREDLYEAVWSQSVLTLAKGMGISDVGLAKICKALNVPRPPRGYWAKPPAVRKLLKQPLTALQPGEDEVYRCSHEVVGGSLACTREALMRLAEEGVALPTACPHPAPGGHPLITAHRDLLAREDGHVREAMAKQACLAVLVSPPLLARALAILQRVFEAFEKHGYQPEVLPPRSKRWPDGHLQPIQSRTGVRIQGVFVAFELSEVVSSVRVPPPPAPPPAPRRGRPKAHPVPVLVPAPEPVYETVSALILEIVEPKENGIRKRWKDTGKRRLEDALDGFLRAAMAFAEHKHTEMEEQERKRREEEAAHRLAVEAAARQAELAARRYDLESRILDVQEAQAIRSFLELVRADAEARGIASEEGTPLGTWLDWTRDLAERLERAAVQNLSQRRIKPPRAPSPAPAAHEQPRPNEAAFYHEIDVWRRRAIFGRR